VNREPNPPPLEKEHRMQNPTLRRNRKRRQRGMTLIEIMVVLVILGMIAGAIGFNVVAQLKAANIKTATTETKTLANAVDLYQVKKQQLPDTLEVLVPSEIRELRKDPWQTPYVLVKNGENFEILSYGPDKSQGGGDDISSNSAANNQ